MNESEKQSRNLILALYVLTGILTREQMEDLCKDESPPIPGKWQDIVKFIEELNND